MAARSHNERNAARQAGSAGITEPGQVGVRPPKLAGWPSGSDCLHRLVEDYESLQIYAASMETRRSIMPLTGADGLSTCRSLAALKMIKW